MRGKGARPTKVYPITETSHPIRFLSVSIDRPNFGCLLPIIGSVVKIQDFAPTSLSPAGQNGLPKTNFAG